MGKIKPSDSENAAGAKKFFENTFLKKTYYYQDKVNYTGKFVYDRVEGTKIKWKDHHPQHPPLFTGKALLFHDKEDEEGE
ncbi:hypothetical protein PtA15_3A424 [Puccinia triticina]|uniref:Uncharacterized protein n=1 Tax=Puccinia triticina TaxID=208348 RepID=A0ABY7CGJ1_9BASI|nr:uncharacterized protein PtA15_3A424 [Puccinia triticina]WAQ83057.1 hypothetical protein PtA15_3A424 [Puccinia triticina]